MKNAGKQKIRLIILTVLAALLTGLIIVLLFIRNDRKVGMPLAYDSMHLAYNEAAETAVASDDAYGNELCVGENDVGNPAISLPSSEHAALFSMEDREVVFAKGMYEKIYPASVTKIMTAIVALKYGNMDDVVTFQWQDLELESGSQVCGFRIGDSATMSELMHGLIVHSGNDAAMAIARHIGGSASGFVKMMNEEAYAIGATSTHFVTPTGLHDENHYTTVYDIYLMLNEALKYPDFVDMMQIAVYDMTYTDKEGKERVVTLDATDHYLTKEDRPPKDVTVIGGKTGTTVAAGNCLAILAQNAFGQPYIAIVMGAPDKVSLYRDMNLLLSVTNS